MGIPQHPLMGGMNTIMKRYAGNPILTPQDFSGAEAVFNCGQVTYNGKTILLVAIIMGNDPMPRIHVAESDDGLRFRIRPEPFISSSKDPRLDGLDLWTIDPRVTYFPEEETYYIMRPGQCYSGVVALLGKTKDFQTYEDIEVISLPSNRVPCLFPRKINGQYVRLDRPYALTYDVEPCNPMGHIWLSSSPDLIHWGRHRLVQRPWIHWNGFKIGPTPPIETPDGWLEIIHGVSGSGNARRYSIGAMLLDLDDPTKVIGCANSPIFIPDTTYECQGRVPNVVFPCGAIADIAEDNLRIYYGAADTCIGLATGKISEIINLCKTSG
ncbi:MAG: glycoside hydrolase family 130 protein [bacterium]